MSSMVHRFGIFLAAPFFLCAVVFYVFGSPTSDAHFFAGPALICGLLVYLFFAGLAWVFSG